MPKTALHLAHPLVKLDAFMVVSIKVVLSQEICCAELVAAVSEVVMNGVGGGDRLTRSTVTSMLSRAAHPSVCARCGAGAGCSATKYQSLFLYQEICCAELIAAASEVVMNQFAQARPPPLIRPPPALDHTPLYSPLYGGV